VENQCCLGKINLSRFVKIRKNIFGSDVSDKINDYCLGDNVSVT